VRVTLIHNPGAGRRVSEAKDLKTVLRRAGHEVNYQSSKEDGWKLALKEDADLVVIAGGDGTVGRVVRCMAGRDVPLALLPSGTANNIARTLGQLERPFEELVRGWESARVVRLDVGHVAGPWGERNFVEGVGVGVFADLLARSEMEKREKKKKKRGAKRKAPVEEGMRRVQQQVHEAEPLEVFARLDGRDISGRYLMLEAVNLRYVGPNLHLAADSTPGDGQFDVVLVTEAERARLVHYLDHWQDNRDRLAILPTVKGSRLQLEWHGFPLHIDDKLKPGAKAKPSEVAGLVDARINGTGVRFLVPDSKNRRD
jgi:diacylglycerol kinase family enzyme